MLVKMDAANAGGGAMVKSGYIASNSEATKIELPWKPDVIIITGISSSNSRRTCATYLSEFSDSQYQERLGEVGYQYTIPINDAYGIYGNIEDDGFTIGSGIRSDITWFACKYL